MKQVQSTVRATKVVLAESDQHLVRVAAALRSTSMRKFARQAVLDEARRATAGMKLPNITPEPAAAD
jgi:hypothetical protein